MRVRSSPRLVFLALGFAVISYGTTQSLLVPVLPVIQVDLNTDTAGITWALTLWLMAGAVATPLFGRVGDLVGKRRTLLLALVIVAVGCVICAVAPNLGLLLFGRVLQGVGGVIYPLAFALVRESVPPHRVAAGIGVMAALASASGVVGTVVVGPLSAVVGWRGLFVPPLIGVLFAAVLTLRSVPESTERASGGVNLAAALLLSAGLVAFLFALSSGNGWGWASLPVLGLFSLAAVLLAAWVVVELRSSESLVDFRMMQLPGVWNANVVGFLIGATMSGLWAFLELFVQEPRSTGYGLGANVSQAGLAMSPMLVFLPLAGFLVGPLARIARPPTQVVAGALLAALSILSIVALLRTDIWVLAIAGAFFGLGAGLVYAAMTAVVVQSVPTTQTGVATSMNNIFFMIGNGIGPALMSTVVTGFSVVGGAPTEAGYTTGFFLLAATAAIAAIISTREHLRLRRVAGGVLG